MCIIRNNSSVVHMGTQPSLGSSLTAVPTIAPFGVIGGMFGRTIYWRQRYPLVCATNCSAASAPGGMGAPVLCLPIIAVLLAVPSCLLSAIRSSIAVPAVAPVAS